jgi:hypothetical protein
MEVEAERVWGRKSCRPVDAKVTVALWARVRGEPPCPRASRGVMMTKREARH